MSSTMTHPGQYDNARSPSGQDVKGKVQEAGTAVADKAKEVAGSAVEKAKEVATVVGNKAEDAKSAVSGGMESLAHTIESGAKYLKEEDLKTIADDVGKMIQRNPIPAVVVGVGLGFLIGRALRS